MNTLRIGYAYGCFHWAIGPLHGMLDTIAKQGAISLFGYALFLGSHTGFGRWINRF